MKEDTEYLSDQLNLLKSDRNYMLEPSHWIQGSYAQNQYGSNVHWLDPAAVKFDAVGRVRSHNDFEYAGTIEYQFEMYSKANGYPGPFDFNDSSTHAEVLTMFDAAINALEQHLEYITNTCTALIVIPIEQTV